MFFIIDSGRTSVINVDNISHMFLSGKHIHAVHSGTIDCLLGAYETPERAEEVWNTMLSMLFPKPAAEEPRTVDELNKFFSRLGTDEINEFFTKGMVTIPCEEPYVTEVENKFIVYYMPEE